MVSNPTLYWAKKATASIARGPKCGNNNRCAYSLLFKSFPEQGGREWYYSGTEGDPPACPSSTPVWLADCELLRETGRVAPLDSELPQEGASQRGVNTCSTCWGSWEDSAIKRTLQGEMKINRGNTHTHTHTRAHSFQLWLTHLLYWAKIKLIGIPVKSEQSKSKRWPLCVIQGIGLLPHAQ